MSNGKKARDGRSTKEEEKEEEREGKKRSNTMGMKITVQDHTSQVINALYGQIAIALDAVGKSVEYYTDIYTPKDTGNLRLSINHIVDGKKVVIGTNVEYAKYVEYREELHHAPPTKAHYLRDSVSNHIDVHKEVLRANLKG